MVKLPAEPPTVKQLRDIGAEIQNIGGDTVLVRIYRRGGDYPTRWDDFRHFGPLNARFDHHPAEGSARYHDDHGIYYAATDLTTCAAEVFQDTRTLNLSREEPWLEAFEPQRPLELLDLTGAWPTRIGASMKINTGPRAHARGWSRRFYAAFPEVDGLLYASSMHANEAAVALYERARDAFGEQPLDRRPLRDPVLLGDLKRTARRLNYQLVVE